MSSGILSQRPGLTKNYLHPGTRKSLTNRRSTTIIGAAAPKCQAILSHKDSPFCLRHTPMFVENSRKKSLTYYWRARAKIFVKQNFWAVFRFSGKNDFYRFFSAGCSTWNNPVLDENDSHLAITHPVIMAICKSTIITGQMVRIISMVSLTFSALLIFSISWPNENDSQLRVTFPWTWASSPACGFTSLHGWAFITPYGTRFFWRKHSARMAVSIRASDSAV